ncbi:S26 family signal peptidase [Phytohabitans kaempferiae]|uniref:S26 family signal peptidase n=1 Tax=Phytohabitans kaempferiae TaxID=1620943 RepID=A0ABV6M9K0_9ACTN
MTPYLIGVTAATAICVATSWLRWRLRIITVVSASMRPTLAPGDRILVCRTAGRRPQRRHCGARVPRPRRTRYRPPSRDNWLVKRAVATPGDPVPASVAPVLSVRRGRSARAGALIAIGDSRDMSLDSRAFGYVFADDLLGVVLRPTRTGAR